MASYLLRLFILCLALSCAGTPLRAGIANYTERGSIDFDKALHLLNPYGTWAKIDGVWAYTPLNHETPYTDGRWLYTEFGWYWKGNNPHSWLTEHYGYWKRSPDKVWSWYPGTYWLSQIIEFRATPTHIGWRSAQVDRDGNFVESPDDRYTKPDEWTFVTKAQFANPITPGMITKPEATEELLNDSTDCHHAYMTYRPLERPGPHPADFVKLCKDGGMFSPLQGQEIVSSSVPATTTPPPPTTAAASTNAPAAKSPALAGLGDDPDQVDVRQVKYWVTMSLPTYWTPRPSEAKVEEVYMYRPDFYQDEDGIQRRITLWFNPLSKTSLKEVFAESMNRKQSAPVDSSTTPTTPAQPATPAVSASTHNPFSSPLDAPYRASHSSASSSKASPEAAPSGLANSTNSAPSDGK